MLTPNSTMIVNKLKHGTFLFFTYKCLETAFEKRKTILKYTLTQDCLNNIYTERNEERLCSGMHKLYKAMQPYINRKQEHSFRCTTLLIMKPWIMNDGLVSSLVQVNAILCIVIPLFPSAFLQTILVDSSTDVYNFLQKYYVQ